MARRPVKIKHYSNVSGRLHRPRFGRVLLGLLAAAAVFALGWFAAPRCIDAVTGLWYRHFWVRREDSSSESLSQSEQQTPTEQPEQPGLSEQPPVEEPVQADAAGVWAEVDRSTLQEEQTLRSTLSALAAAGVDHVLLTLKDESGTVYYATDSTLAATADAVRAQVDVPLFVRLCGEYGLTPCARLYAFRDPLAAYADRSAAVQYQQEGILWLDSSAELGGKPWLNPYSQTARQYVQGLAEELADLGIADVVFSGVQFPSGYALEVCYYGEGAATVTRTQCLRECVALWESAVEKAGARAWFEWPSAAADGADAMVYGDGAAACGAQRVLLTAAAGEQPPELAAFAAAAAQAGTVRLGLNTAALAQDDAQASAWQSAARAAGFTHFWA